MTRRSRPARAATLANPLASLALGLALLALLVASILAVAPPASAQGSGAQETVASGTFQKKGFRVDGSWKLVRQGDSLVLELDGKFSTKNGPDLKFFLSPRPAARVNGNNAARESLLVGELRSNRGAQRFSLPAGTDLSRFQSLVLHCEKYSKLWAASPLR